MPLFDLALDALLVTLLAITAGYCFVLERKLRALRSGQDGLKDVIESLEGATDRAQASLDQIKTEGTSAGSALLAQSQKAADLVDELKIMIQSGDRLADRLAGTRRDHSTLALPGPREDEIVVEPIVEDHADLISALSQAR